MFSPFAYAGGTCTCHETRKRKIPNLCGTWTPHMEPSLQIRILRNLTQKVSLHPPVLLVVRIFPQRLTAEPCGHSGVLSGALQKGAAERSWNVHSIGRTKAEELRVTHKRDCQLRTAGIASPSRPHTLREWGTKAFKYRGKNRRTGRDPWRSQREEGKERKSNFPVTIKSVIWAREFPPMVQEATSQQQGTGRPPVVYQGPILDPIKGSTDAVSKCLKVADDQTRPKLHTGLAQTLSSGGGRVRLICRGCGLQVKIKRHGKK